MFLVSLLSIAAAGPLQDVAKIELTNAREIHRVVLTADAVERFEVSKTCLDAATKAKTEITAARALFDAEKHKEGYLGVHEALRTLRPCADEFAKGKTKSFHLGLKVAMRSSVDQLKALEAHLESKGTPDAKQAYADAVVASKSSRAHMLAGEIPEAVTDWYTSIEAMLKSVRAST